MRTKVTLVLLFLNVALFFFIFYVRRTLDISPEVAAARQLILPPAANDLSEISITLDKQVVKLMRRGDSWHVTAPIEWPANKIAVKSILDELRTLKHEASWTVASITKNNMSLADYGLDKPAVILELTPTKAAGEPATQADKITLRIGSNTSSANRLYVLSPDGTRIHAIQKNLAECLTLPLEQLRAENLFSIAEFEARNLTIQLADSASANRTRVSHEGTRWTMINPVEARADSSVVQTFITQLRGLQVQEFISTALPPDINPASSPTLRLTLEGNNRSETLLIGGLVPAQRENSAPLWYAQFEWKVEDERKSAVFSVRIPNSVMEILRASSEKLRDRRILDLNTSTVSSLVIQAPNAPEITLQRIEAASTADGERWQITSRLGETASNAQPADTQTVRALLDRLARLEARRFIDTATAADLESWGFTNRPERRLTLRQDNGGQQARSTQLDLGVSAVRGPEAYARSDSSRSIYTIDAELLQAIPADTKAWRDRNLTKLPAGAHITGIRLTDLTNDKKVFDQSLPEAPSYKESLALAKVPEAARPAWEALIESLRALRAKAFHADHYAESISIAGNTHPWRYRLEVDVSLQSGAGNELRTYTLMFSERLGGSLQLVGSTNLDALFEAEQGMVDAFWALTYGPADPGPVVPKAAPATAPAATTPATPPTEAAVAPKTP